MPQLVELLQIGGGIARPPDPPGRREGAQSMQSSTAAHDVFLFEFFGGPTLSCHGETVAVSPMQGALLALLHTSDGKVLSRAEVLEKLWPRENPYRARRRLSQLIYSIHLRTPRRPLLRAEGERIQGLAGVVRTDLQQFLLALEQDRFDEAWSMLAKGFLPLLEHTASRAFSDWREGKTAELRGLLRRGAERRYHQAIREGDWGLAAKTAEVLLALRPEDEGLLRNLLTAYWKAGDNVRAEELLREFVARREEEEGRSWSPQPATLELVSRMQASPKVREPSPAFLTFRAEEEPPLVGRDRERALIRKTLRAPPTKDLRTILLIGEAGLGKTRLIWEGIDGLEREGQRVLTARAVELERIIPLNPLIEAFAPSWVGEVMRGLEEPWRTVLYGVMPHHYPGKGPIPTPPEIQPGSVPRRLFEAVYQLLLALTAQAPVVLVVDDVQWADETTLAVLQFLVRRWENGSLQIVLAMRTEEVSLQKALLPLLTSLRDHGEFVEMKLSELDPAASDRLLNALISRKGQGANRSDIRDSDLSEIRLLGAGNPLFLIELSAEFLGSRGATGRSPTSQTKIPRSIGQLVERRLSWLSRQALVILGTLAVSGRGLSIDDLCQITGQSGADTLGSLMELGELRLATSEGGHFFLNHELLRQTVYHNLDRATRTWLHRKLAEHLLATRDPHPVDELALHYSLAGLSAPARRYALTAAFRAETSGAIPEALGFLSIAQNHSPNSDERRELTGRMGHLNYLHQNLGEAVKLLEVGTQWARDKCHLDIALLWEAERLDCLASLGKISHPSFVSQLDHLRQEAASLNKWEIYTVALDIELHHCDRRADVNGARSVLKLAHQVADSPSYAVSCRAHAMLALQLHFGVPNTAIGHARKALALAALAKRPDLELLATNRLIVVLLLQGLLGAEENHILLTRAEEIAKRAGDIRLKFLIRQNTGVWFLEIGEYDRALAIFRSAEDILTGTAAEESKALVALNSAEALLGLRDIESARDRFLQAVTHLRQVSSRPLSLIIHAGLGLCALHEGRLEEAVRRENEIDPLPDWWFFDPSLVVTFKARMLTFRGRNQEADRLLESAAAQVEQRFVTSWIKLVLERGRLLRRQRDVRSRLVLAPALEKAKSLGLQKRLMELEFLAS